MTHQLFKLKEPSKEQIDVSNQLKKEIIQAIEKSETKSIGFSQFMNLALYSNFGYYKNGSQKFAKEGDFITAPEMGLLFANALVPVISEAFKKLKSNMIFEIGAGSGKLMLDLFQTLEKTSPIEKYFVLEISSELKKRQADLIKKKAPQFFERIIWLNTLDDLMSFNQPKAVVIANEVLDTFIFDLFIQTNCTRNPNQINIDETKQRKVSINPAGDFCFVDEQLNAKQTEKLNDLNAIFKQQSQYYFFENQYQSEFPINYGVWLKSIFEYFSQSFAIFIDYGLNNKQYYAPDKKNGHFRLFFKHLVHQDPFYYVGLSDLTTSVNFSHFYSELSKTELKLIHYTTLSQFMLHCPFEEIFQNTTDIKEQVKLTSEFKRLVMPSEMGEIFKVMVLGFNLENESGFEYDFISRDLSHSL